MPDFGERQKSLKLDVNFSMTPNDKIQKVPTEDFEDSLISHYSFNVNAYSGGTSSFPLKEKVG
jgi:hypothetical protein